MKKALVFMGALLFLVAPAAVFAESFLGPIVPQNIQDGGPYLQACHLVQLFDSALKFAVGFATLVATIMFVYAGFLYVTAAANQDNLNKAKSVFGNVFIGFVIVLVAWLVVDLIMSVFVNEKEVGPWNRIECVEKRINPLPDLGAISTSNLTGDDRLEAENRALLAAFDVAVNANACKSGQTTGCTNVGGLSAKTLGYVGDLKKQCDTVAGESCRVVVTGGSEGGHAGGTNPGSHGAGDKIDIRPTPTVKDYVAKQVESGAFTKVDKPSFGSAQYIDTKTGAIWTDEGDHYDICVSNCKAPAAQGS